MKNIYLLPTDKSSRLVLDDTTQNLILINKGEALWGNQNVYITSDEKIKIDDYYLGDDNNIYCLVTSVNYNGKKIILTTDQELIDNGVQAIDDEFLNWFVNNSDCEFVKIEDYGNLYNFRYLVLIPKEESKQHHINVHLNHCYQGEYKDSCKYGDEDCPAKKNQLEDQLLQDEIDYWYEKTGSLTSEDIIRRAYSLGITKGVENSIETSLKKAAEEYSKMYFSENKKAELGFIAGAKWQKQQDEREIAMLRKKLKKIINSSYGKYY